MYIIQKPAEFGPDNMPLSGQCELHTPGWRLYHAQAGRLTMLFEASYYICRHMQTECSGKSFDEAKRIIADIAESMIESNAQETVKLAGLNPPEAPKAS